MKKTLVIFILFLLFVMQISAESTQTYNWYCIRNKNNEQPELDANIKFIEEYDGYYVDRSCKNSDEKVIYLTFDFGYENGNVEKIVDIMKNENVVGSFFILDNVIYKNINLINKISDNGNLVCNHTAKHRDITKLSIEELKNELEVLETLYKEKTGREMTKYFRPPEGKFSKQNLIDLQSLGYKTIFWSFAYADWDNNKQMSPDKAKEKILSNIHNGAILLLHPTSSTNAEILGDIIKTLKADGFTFKTLDEL